MLTEGGRGLLDGGSSGYERINETHLSVFHSVSNHARGKRSRNSVSSAARYAFNSLFLSRARDFILIQISNSKQNLNEIIFESKGAPGVSGALHSLCILRIGRIGSL